MKKVICFILTLALTAGLWGCAREVQPSEPESTPAAQTIPTTQPPQTEAPTTQPAPLHSQYYIEGISVEDVIIWFSEVCLDAEYSDSADFRLLQKWTSPLRYCVSGTPTQEDLEVLQDLAQTLNDIEGFPGIAEAEDEYVNLRITFCQSNEELIQLMGENFVGSENDGAVTFWFNDFNEITDADVCCRADIDQQIRSAVILEELYNGLGPIQDSELRSDSIIYQHGSEVQELSPVDVLILQLLYHPDMKCGMTVEECEAVIRALYY